LIVIAVLGILAAIVIFKVTGVTNKGSIAACKIDLHSVRVPNESYYNDNQTYPSSIDDLLHGYLHGAPTDMGSLTFDSDGEGTVTRTLC
jgi:type II secretory pathway pseudopilin PulG